jgi:hypothetical protein
MDDSITISPSCRKNGIAEDRHLAGTGSNLNQPGVGAIEVQHFNA